MSKQLSEKRTHQLLSHEPWSTDETALFFVVEEIHAYIIMATAELFLLRQDPPPLEAILVIFGRRALIFFVVV